MSSINHIQDITHFHRSLSESNALKVAFFYATWSEPCKSFRKDFEAASNKYADSVKFLAIDVDDCEEVASAYSIKVMPTFILFKGNMKIDEFAGTNSTRLTQSIDHHKAM